jgi:tRNA(adenine34) deaminase
MKQALRRLNRVSLEDCTIYTNAEPCALCSYAMRETRIGRVVFGVPAPLTGGLSRWNILADVELSNTLPEVFAPSPEIVPGFMHEQVEAAMARRTPITWGSFGRGTFLAVHCPLTSSRSCRSSARRISANV